MEVIILASGSKGNAISIKTKKTQVLIDIGISFQKTKKKLEKVNNNIKNIQHLFITHEHQDHIKGLRTFLKNKIVKNIYLTKGTYNSLDLELRSLFPTNIIFIKSENEFQVEDLIITPFLTSHDAAEPVGFVIENLNRNKKIVILTDTGYVDHSYHNLLKNADLYILESNHDSEMLMKSQRPFYLKRRIISEKGHLSNIEASMLINEFIKEKEKSIWAIAHISEDCNTKLKIEEAIVDVIDDPTKLEILYTSQDTSKIIKL